MSNLIPWLSHDAAKIMLDRREWRSALTIAPAFAYQRSILHSFGDMKYRSTFPERDEVRVELKLTLVTASLEVLRHTLCHSSCSKSFTCSPWIVYHGNGRFPYMKSITPLPKNVAAWFTHVPVHWAGPGLSPAIFSNVLSAAMNSSDVLPLQSFSRHALSLAWVGEENSILNAQSSVPRRVLDPQ